MDSCWWPQCPQNNTVEKSQSLSCHTLAECHPTMWPFLVLQQFSNKRKNYLGFWTIISLLCTWRWCLIQKISRERHETSFLLLDNSTRILKKSYLISYKYFYSTFPCIVSFYCFLFNICLCKIKLKKYFSLQNRGQEKAHVFNSQYMTLWDWGLLSLIHFLSVNFFVCCGFYFSSFLRHCTYVPFYPTECHSIHIYISVAQKM